MRTNWKWAEYWDKISRPGNPGSPNAWRERLLYIFLNLLIIVSIFTFIGDMFSSLEDALFGALGVVITIGCRLLAQRNVRMAGWVLVALGVLFVRFALGDIIPSASGGLTLAMIAVLGSALIASWAGLITAIIASVGLLPFTITNVGMVIGLGASVWIITALVEGALQQFFKANLELTQIKNELENRVDERTAELKTALVSVEEEKQRSDELLRVILPDQVIAELKRTSRVQPRRFENVGVLVCDIVNFTSYCNNHEPEEVVKHLQMLVEGFEEMAGRHRLQKIKTSGDSFLTTAGLFEPLERPALNCIQCGLEMVQFAPSLPPSWQVRVGIHIGPVIAGIVGRKQYLFDILGDTVNTASRIEAVARPGTVTVSMDTWQQLSASPPLKFPELVNLKGKGEVQVFQIEQLDLERLVIR